MTGQFKDDVDNRFGPASTITARKCFKGLTGRLLWDKVMKLYAVDHGVTLHVFTDVTKDGENMKIKLLLRHPANNRGMKVQIGDLAESILAHGVQPVHRGPGRIIKTQ